MKTHGKRNTPTYSSWINMRQRCNNPNDRSYPNYGGRGISICRRWESFVKFLEDMGERPIGYSLERIDVNKNYCKSNCRWATTKEQIRNTRVNRKLTYGGRIQCLAAWAEEYGLLAVTLAKRLRDGWSLRRALESKINETRHGVAHCQTFYEYRGETRNLKDWCRHFGLSYAAVHKRITSYGMSFEVAVNTPIRKRQKAS